MLAANCRANQTAYGNAWADAAEKSVGSRILFSSMLVPLIASAMCPRSTPGPPERWGGAARAGGPTSRAHAVHIDQLFSRALESIQENPGHPAYQFVGKITVLLSLLPSCLRVACNL